ncbi:MAG: hypothetical protein HYZ27_09770, partial [Deltaproteobacteria bacterium]|nr:hypothetical protein [Deltaproteobacteria bacterium]
MTKDVDVAVSVESAFDAIDALSRAGYRSSDPERMYVLTDEHGGEVDLLVAAGEPESTVIAEALSAQIFGATAPVASLEHLLL